MREQNNRQNASVDEIVGLLNKLPEQADSLYYERLKLLHRVRTIKDVQFKRKHELLKTELGAQHPDVLALESRIKANLDLIRAIEYSLRGNDA